VSSGDLSDSAVDAELDGGNVTMSTPPSVQPRYYGGGQMKNGQMMMTSTGGGHMTPMSNHRQLNEIKSRITALGTIPVSRIIESLEGLVVTSNFKSNFWSDYFEISLLKFSNYYC